MSLTHRSLVMCATALASALLGCDSDSASKTSTSTGADSQGGTSLEIAGTWSTPFGDETITNTLWTSGLGKMAIVQADNAKNTAYTQTSADDQYSPNKFNKIVWTEPAGGSFFYCMVDYAKDTLALAEASTLTADNTDPAKGGCGGFAWTKMTKK